MLADKSVSTLSTREGFTLISIPLLDSRWLWESLKVYPLQSAQKKLTSVKDTESIHLFPSLFFSYPIQGPSGSQRARAYPSWQNTPWTGQTYSQPCTPIKLTPLIAWTVGWSWSTPTQISGEHANFTPARWWIRTCEATVLTTVQTMHFASDHVSLLWTKNQWLKTIDYCGSTTWNDFSSFRQQCNSVLLHFASMFCLFFLQLLSYYP